jgi:hypothetical protein
MDTTTSVVLTGTIVTVGTWSEGKPLNVRIVVGGTVLAVTLAALDSSNPQFAQAMAALILTAALFEYAIPIAHKLGFAQNIAPDKTKPSKFGKTGGGSFGTGGAW